jgi:hypothetical protein
MTGDDYISLKIEQLGNLLNQVAQLKKEAQWLAAAEAVGTALKNLLGADYRELMQLSETGFLAKLVRYGPTVWVPYNIAILIALLKEAGDVATARYPPRGGYGWYLKALHLLLDESGRGQLAERFEFMPDAEALLKALKGSPLPVRTRLLLMRDFERRGLYGRAADEFQAAIKTTPHNQRLLNIGIAFFERLAYKRDTDLEGMGLPRRRILSTLEELSTKKIGVLTDLGKRSDR